jgi:hypothetical protein
VRRKDRERRHCIDRYRFGEIDSEGLSEERYPTLSFTTGWEELALESLVTLRNEEGRRPQTAFPILTRVDLMIQQLLHVFD